MKQFIAFSRDKGEKYSIKDIYDQKRKKIGAVGHKSNYFFHKTVMVYFFISLLTLAF